VKLHLIRLCKAQGEARFPGVEGFRAYYLQKPEDVPEPRMYLVLEGEVVVDLPEGNYLHLRRGEAAYLPAEHKITPIDPSVVAVWKP